MVRISVYVLLGYSVTHMSSISGSSSVCKCLALRISHNGHAGNLTIELITTA